MKILTSKKGQNYLPGTHYQVVADVVEPIGLWFPGTPVCVYDMVAETCSDHTVVIKGGQSLNAQGYIPDGDAGTS